MRNRYKNILCCMGSTIALSAFWAVPAFADADTESYVETNAEVQEEIQEESQVDTAWEDKVAANVNTFANIRVDSTINSERVGRLPKAGVATVLGEKDGWYQVSSGEIEGFIRADLLVSGEDAKVLYVDTYGESSGTVDGEWIVAEPAPVPAPTPVKEPAPAKEPESEAESEAEPEADAEVESEETSAAVSNSELDLMAAIIECEAGGESYDGKVAVGAVIMNRINSGKFPNSLSEVIYQKGQFSPVASGKLAKVLARGARQDCYDAAGAVFNGANTIGDKLFFSAGSGKGIQIGNQHFY